MNKNRRNTKYSNFQGNFQEIKIISLSNLQTVQNIQNEATMALLGIQNDENMLTFQQNQIKSCLRVTQKRNQSQSKLSNKKKWCEDKQNNFKYKTEMRNKENMVLGPIDCNINFDLIDFKQQKQPIISTKKQRFSLRNAFSTNSKHRKSFNEKQNESKKEEKTILNLKKILKKLESPQKQKKMSHQDQFQMLEKMVKRKKGDEKISEYCSQFVQKQFLTKKNRQTTNQYKLKSNKSHQNIQYFDFRSGAKTSQQQRRFSFGLSTHNNSSNTPSAYNYKPLKLTNKSMLFKRNSITAGESNIKNFYEKGFRKMTGRINTKRLTHKCSRSEFEDVFIQQERAKQQRKSRNLKNLLFE